MKKSTSPSRKRTTIKTSDRVENRNLGVHFNSFLSSKENKETDTSIRLDKLTNLMLQSSTNQDLGAVNAETSNQDLD